MSGSKLSSKCRSQFKAAGLGEFIVLVAGARNAQRDVGGVGCDLVRDASLLDVVTLGQPKVLLGRHVAEHRGTMPCRIGRTDARRDVVVPGEDVRDQWAKDVERHAFVALSSLQLHVVFDLVQGHVAGAFDHHLDSMSPRTLGEFTDDFEFSQLRAVGGVGQTARAKTVTDGEAHIVLTHDPAQVIPQLVHGIFLILHEHPLGQASRPGRRCR